MKELNISYLWCHDNVKEFIIPKIIESYFSFKINWCKPNKAEILIVGNFRKYKKFYEYFNKKTYIQKFLKDIEFSKNKFFKIKNKKIILFYNVENERIDNTKYDFVIGSDFNYNNTDNYMRIPTWKNYINWDHLKLRVSSLNSLNAVRFGNHYNLFEMMKPQGELFLSKRKNICCFFTHVSEPRKSMIRVIENYFKIDGYGKYFDSKIKNHNSSNFSKLEIFKNYFANFCPENEIFPGWYTEKVPDAFLGKTLPITWSDQNIENDFNKLSFINLNDNLGNLDEIFLELRSEEFLKKFSKEPLLLKEINLNNEIKFVEKMLNNFR
tara:strand:+ start:36 stop:1007 length:972 start_codon:yes stop_codon:yes gene_type:complete